ncbi:MAG TPA: hypothetical protein VNZ53_34935, partial [Steroidobacteraceae bacterium]|nr:hypothetical protein [Steroidobacteraceae bacterium]
MTMRGYAPRVPGALDGCAERGGQHVAAIWFLDERETFLHDAPYPRGQCRSWVDKRHLGFYLARYYRI